MNGSEPVHKLRWLVHGMTTHVLYERDDDWSKTLCGKLLRGGSIKVAAIKAVEGKCRECLAKVRVRNKIVHD